MKRMQEEKIFNQIKDDVSELKESKLFNVCINILDNDDGIIGAFNFNCLGSDADSIRDKLSNYARSIYGNGFVSGDYIIELDLEALEYKAFDSEFYTSFDDYEIRYIQEAIYA